jgi:hypothetical protein
MDDNYEIKRIKVDKNNFVMDIDKTYIMKEIDIENYISNEEINFL